MNPNQTSQQPASKGKQKPIIIGCGVVLLLIGCLCCLLLGVGAVGYRVTYPALPSQTEALIETVDDQVAEIRGLTFQQPVSFTLMTSDELRDTIEEDFFEEWSPEEAQNTAISMAAFDYIEPDFDLYNLFLDLYSEQIAGYYDPEEKALFVISNDEEVSVMQRLTLAHELTHALQDQHFDLEQLVDDEDKDETDAEADFAFRALVEGEALFVEQKYLFYIAPHEYPQMALEVFNIDTDVLDTTPAVIVESQIFPYREGLAFVNTLYDEGGWSAINTAYENPPVSTEQILHPDRYQMGDVPLVVTVPALTDTLGSGWRWVEEGPMGEFSLRLHLSQHLSPTVVTEAATGWGGDQYAVYYHDDDKSTVLLYRTRWDTPADTAEFLATYTRYLAEVAQHPADTTTDSQQCWNLTTETRCLIETGNEIIIIRVPDEAIVQPILDTVLGD